MSEISPISPGVPPERAQEAHRVMHEPEIKLDETQVSPFQKFLGPAATKEEVKKFINQWVRDIMRDMQKADARWKESMRKMRESM